MRLHGTASILPNGHLAVGGCDTTELARSFGTPLWVLDEELFRENCRAFRAAFGPDLFPHGSDVVYASKALLTTAVCRIVDEEGLGLDVVSGGELHAALAAGFLPDRLYFHGNNKSPDELSQALEAGLGRFIVDNFCELEALDSLSSATRRRAAVLLRLAPGIEAHTHAYVQTGQVDSKFGFPIRTGQALRAVERALALDSIELRGLHCHLGSQILEAEPYARAVETLMGFAASVRASTGWLPEELDLGGGFGVRYTGSDQSPSPHDYAAVVSAAVQAAARRLGLPVPKILVEPGRAIAAQAGWTLYTVGCVKEIPGVRSYLVVDGGMGDNPRPALYHARHEACLANRASEPPSRTFTVAGRYCESGDILIHDVDIPDPRPGDLLAVSCTGAYNYTMAMNYNRVPRPAMVLVSQGRADVIVERETYADLLARERIPGRLASLRERRRAAPSPGQPRP